MLYAPAVIKADIQTFIKFQNPPSTAVLPIDQLSSPYNVPKPSKTPCISPASTRALPTAASAVAAQYHLYERRCGADPASEDDLETDILVTRDKYLASREEYLPARAFTLVRQVFKSQVPRHKFPDTSPRHKPQPSQLLPDLPSRTFTHPPTQTQTLDQFSTRAISLDDKYSTLTARTGRTPQEAACPS